MFYLNVHTTRKKGETFESFLRRFNKRLIGSGKLIHARKIRYKTKSVSKNKVKDAALRKKTIKEKFDYLAKIGQLPDDRMGRKKRRR